MVWSRDIEVEEGPDRRSINALTAFLQEKPDPGHDQPIHS